jgi:chromatin segregation and condensation protein Rec8/ScpA/Scc1 (kleisin family)
VDEDRFDKLNQPDIHSYAKYRKMMRGGNDEPKKRFVQYELSDNKPVPKSPYKQSNYNESVTVKNNPQAFNNYRNSGRSELKPTLTKSTYPVNVNGSVGRNSRQMPDTEGRRMARSRQIPDREMTRSPTFNARDRNMGITNSRIKDSRAKSNLG